MSHADTLRGMASGSHPGLSYASVVALIAGVEALDTLARTRAALTDLRDDCRRNAEAAAWLAQGSTDSLEPIFSELADGLTRILEGDNHE